MKALERTGPLHIAVEPGRLRGMVNAPPSKSAAHRAAICAALAPGRSVLHGVEETQDMKATIRAAQALGARCILLGGDLVVEGAAAVPGQAEIDCHESGSTLRFFVPIAAALGVTASFYGRGELPNRPMGPLTEAMESHGVRAFQKGGEILTVEGRLESGRYAITGSVSSQYITGLLFALPLLEGDSELVLTSPLQSAGYVDLTLQMMAAFGVQVEKTAGGYRIPGGQRYQPRDTAVEGDYSGGAFWLCAGALGGPVTVKGLREDSLQGDKQILSILSEMGARVEREGDAVTVSAGALRGVRLDISDIPDLLPVLAATAACAQGITLFTNAARLRLKECDRLSAVAKNLTAMGAAVTERAEELEIAGRASLSGGAEVESFGDHRIPMSMAVAALGCRRPVVIRGAGCVDKSYPGFFEDFAMLGGVCHVL